jgi:hypothetical protein
VEDVEVAADRLLEIRGRGESDEGVLRDDDMLIKFPPRRLVLLLCFITE